MGLSWHTKYGRRRIKHEPPTVAEAVAAAEGLTSDWEEQAEIAAGLLNLPLEAVKAEAGLRRHQQAPRVGPHVVVVQRKRRIIPTRS